MNTQAGSGRAHVGVSRSSEIFSLSGMVRTVALVCGPNATGLDVLPLDADVVIISKTNDATGESAVEPAAYLVVPSGLDLMQELLHEGLIEKSARILWSFGLPVAESMVELERLRLPAGMMVTGFSGEPHRAILATTVCEESALEHESFRMGLETAWLATRRIGPQRDLNAPTTEQRLLHELRAKHLSLLTSLGSAEAVVPRAGLAELENELTIQRRNYAVLERKYNALSRSKLGRLTLKLWTRKRYSTRSNEWN